MFELYLLLGAAVTLIAIKLVSKFTAKASKLTTQNKSLMVTGCDSGIGHMCAKKLDELGFTVFAGCLLPEGPGAQELKKTCSKRLMVVPIDITKEESVRKAAEMVRNNLPSGEKGLYGLVNNAGMLIYANYDWFTMEQAETLVNVNLLGTLRVTKHFMDLVITRAGRIINVTSINGKFAFPGLSVYCATKFGLEGFSAALRGELKKHNVKVIIIEPGDFSKVTNIMDQHTRNLNKMVENLTGTQKDRCENEIKQTLKKMTEENKLKKLDPKEAEKLYNILLGDMVDALLSEKPEICYVSAPTAFRIFFYILTKLPAQIMDRLVEKMVKRANKKS